LTDVQESKITDEHRAVIGVKSDPIPVRVTAEDTRRVRTLLGDDDPRYADGTGVAPPYILAVIDPGMPFSILPRVLPGGLLTQTEWKFHDDIKVDTTLDAIHQVVDVRDRLGGRYGYSVLVMVRTDYVDSTGKALGSALRTITQFDRGDSK
jgi:N-terminal half of MaoC dehydratase